MQCEADFLYIQFEKVAWKGETASVCTVGMQCEADFLYIQQGGRTGDARSGPGMTHLRTLYRSTNAQAEALNTKIKAFRAQLAYRSRYFLLKAWPMAQQRAATTMPLMEAKPQWTRLATMAPATTPMMADQSTAFSATSLPRLQK